MGVLDGFDRNIAVGDFKFLTGVNGFFQSIGKGGCQICFIYRQNAQEDQLRCNTDTISLCQFQIECQNRIEDFVVAVVIKDGGRDSVRIFSCSMRDVQYIISI